MPRHYLAKKDAANGETRRGAVSTHRSVDIRMGEPLHHRCRSTVVMAVRSETQGTETSKYLEEKKVRNDFQSSGERNGKSPNRNYPGL